jgi:4,5-dihydroxyphthalate decarboxylase
MNTITVALGDYPHVRGLLSGDVPVGGSPSSGGFVGFGGFAVEPVTVNPIIGAYRRMIRDLEFDVCELAPTSYLMARDRGIPLTAIPVFLNRRFHHGDIQCAAASGIAVPADLAGRKVGVRAYTVTTGVWVRGILAEEYGVDTGRITWVVDDDDHIEGQWPARVERVTDGRSLGALLNAGEIDAAFTGNAGTGRAGAPTAGWTAADAVSDSGTMPYPLFAEGDVVAADWYLRTGVYPLHSVIAIRSELVAREPELPTALYAAFAENKRRQLSADPEWTALPRFARQARQVGGDPVPYGRGANKASLDALVRFSRDQGLIAADPGEIFAEGDYPDA